VIDDSVVKHVIDDSVVIPYSRPKCQYAMVKIPSWEHGLAVSFQQESWPEKKMDERRAERLEALNVTTNPVEEEWNDMYNELLR
jgi:hypothetical protein